MNDIRLSFGVRNEKTLQNVTNIAEQIDISKCVKEHSDFYKNENRPKIMNAVK